MGTDTEQEYNLRYQAESFARAAQGLAVLADEGDRQILLQYAKYLLGEKPRAYPYLADYLEWYGKKFLLPELSYFLQGHRYNWIYELGPGTGWLLRELTPLTIGAEGVFAVDKREVLFKRWEGGPHFVLLDLEEFPLFKSLDHDPKRTLIIANQFLHCVDNRNTIVKGNRAVWLVVEVNSLIWRKQIAAFGGTSLSSHDIMTMFHDANYHLYQQRRTSTLSITIWHPDER